jgi:Arginase/agmatinase/formimionoglutamate hydrolase, arginase family
VLEVAGLLRALDAVDGGTVDVPQYDLVRDPESGVHNRKGVATQTRRLADLVGTALDRRALPFVVGGDCSVLLGAALALRRLGRFGLVFIDGHLDFRHPGNSNRLSAAAGEDLAIVTGRGLDDHADIDGLRPYFRDGDVAALCERENDGDTSDVLQTEITVFDLRRARHEGLLAVASEALAAVSGAAEGYWIHLDVDVLDSGIMPAVDSPQPDGLQPDELATLLRELTSRRSPRGIDVTIYDPELDPDHGLAELVRAIVSDGLAPLLSHAH